MHVPQPELILASSSPRRRELLSDAGFDFRIEVPGIEEVPQDGEPPETFALRTAREKAEWIAQRVTAPPQGAVVLGADTVVVDGDTGLGKPVDAEDARRMLMQLSGHTHRVVTAVCLCPVPRQAPAGAHEFLVSTSVVFRPLAPETIDAYIATGEPFDKAGAYAIQGHGGALVSRIDGSYTNVVGLPVDEVVQALRDHFALHPGAGRRPA